MDTKLYEYTVKFKSIKSSEEIYERFLILGYKDIEVLENEIVVKEEKNDKNEEFKEIKSINECNEGNKKYIEILKDREYFDQFLSYYRDEDNLDEILEYFEKEFGSDEDLSL